MVVTEYNSAPARVRIMRGTFSFFIVSCILLGGCDDLYQSSSHSFDHLKSKEIQDSIRSLKIKFDAKLLILRVKESQNLVKIQLELPTSKYIISTDYNICILDDVSIIEPINESDLPADRSNLNKLESSGLVGFDQNGRFTHYPGYAFFKCTNGEAMKVYEIFDIEKFQEEAATYSQDNFNEWTLAPNCDYLDLE